MSMQALERLQALLDSKLSLVESQRSTAAGDASLAGVRARVVTAARLVEEGQVAGAAEVMAVAAHDVTDSWSYTSPVSDAVMECAHALEIAASRQG